MNATLKAAYAAGNLPEIEAQAWTRGFFAALAMVGAEGRPLRAALAAIEAVSAVLDAAGVPAHADIAERITMLAEHDREMSVEALRAPAPTSSQPWRILTNGDCEGDGEPEIVCPGCGEEGYHCCCETNRQDWSKIVCRYCGTDCGEAGYHVIDDVDGGPR